MIERNHQSTNQHCYVLSHPTNVEVESPLFADLDSEDVDFGIRNAH